MEIAVDVDKRVIEAVVGSTIQEIYIATKKLWVDKHNEMIRYEFPFVTIGTEENPGMVLKQGWMLRVGSTEFKAESEEGYLFPQLDLPVNRYRE